MFPFLQQAVKAIRMMEYRYQPSASRARSTKIRLRTQCDKRSSYKSCFCVVYNDK